MVVKEFFKNLQKATTSSEIEALLENFEHTHQDGIKWIPVGKRENNRLPFRKI